MEDRSSWVMGSHGLGGSAAQRRPGPSRPACRVSPVFLAHRPAHCCLGNWSELQLTG